MRIDIVEPLELSPADMAAWARLQGACEDCDSPFLAPQWSRACASADGPDRRSGRVAVVRDDAGQAQGFLPFRLSSGGTALPVGAPMADYQALVADPDLDLDPRLLVRAMPAVRFDFSHLMASQALFAPFMRGRAELQVVDVSAGYEAYAAERKASGHEILKDTAKKRRKLERDVGEVVFTPMSASAEDFDTLIEWKRKQYRATRQTDIFDRGWPLEVLKAIHANRDADWGGALFTLHADGKLVAGHLALRNRQVVHCWFIAHDPDFGKYSPGVVLIDHILQWASQQGMRELDMGPGDYRFKLQLANRTRTVAYGFVGRPSGAVLVREAEYRVRSAAESLPLGRLSRWPGKAMRRVDLWRGLAG